MSRIEDLIAKHCPNGVEFIELQKLFTTRNGYTPSRRKPEYWENGTIPWFRLADIRGGDRILTEAIENVSPAAVKQSGLFPAGTIIISTLATIGEHALLEVPGLCNQQLTALTLRESYAASFNIKFLFYYAFVLADWCKKNTMNSSFASVDMKQFKRFKFPVPPLEVQDEIVRILDSYTQLKTDLESELEAELKARGKQYEYYRDWLLSLEYLINSCELSTDDLIPLVELTIRPDRLNWADRDSKNAKYIDLSSVDRSTGRIGDLTEITESDSPSRAQQIVKNNDVLFGTTRPLLRRVAYIPLQLNNEICSTGFCVLRCKNGRLNPRFLYHYIQSNEFYKYVESFQSGASYPSISDKKVKEFKIPVPPLSEQERIVAILDKFDALVNDLSSGLPAEIEARRKQYEYYRDQLLTFTPTK